MNNNFMVINGLTEALGVVEEKPVTYSTIKLDYLVADQDLKDFIEEITDKYIADLSGMSPEDVAIQVVDNKRSAHVVNVHGEVYDLSKNKIIKAIGYGIQTGMLKTDKGIVSFDDMEKDAVTIYASMIACESL